MALRRRWDPVVPTGLAIAILDLQARPDQFQDDASLGSLATELIARGHRVQFVRTVLAAHPGGEVGWHKELQAFVGAGGFDLVLLAHIWLPATVAALRADLRPEARLVRITSGVAAALDASLDHVLDTAGLDALLAGDTQPAPAQWQPQKPADIRAKLTISPTRLTAQSPLPIAAASTQPAQRPMISGPVAGCPFLLDAARNPLFAAVVAADPTLQSKGCSFCLDNNGAFAQPTEAEVIATWLAQLRKLKSQQPGLREIVLTDERPHPHLPGFFRALAGEPALGGVELLIKSRVDWLLQFADTALTEALHAARLSNSVLHIYLMGFENFDQFHLDLFNKAVTVADNLAAIETLIALEAAFPDAFAFRPHRAHGIVLFTPWTTPAALRENARVMRQIQFHQLRTEAVRTRLRLYPRVPLYALAEADGLLTEEFAPGRRDRAAEQGYDASAPWRFADERMEAIFQAANALHDAHPTLTDADLIDLAVNTVLRFPGLAAVPQVAWLPIDQALCSWGGGGPEARRGLDPRILGVDPELELLLAGHKRACLKEGIPAQQAADLCVALRAMGLCADVVVHHGLAAGADAHVPGDGFAIVAVARTPADLAATLHHQRALKSGHDAAGAAQAMGALMGYPPCCVAAFLQQRSRGSNLENERMLFRRAPDAPLHVLLHRVGAIRLLSHHPCRPDCAPSIAQAQTVLAALEAIDPAAAAHVVERLQRPVLFLDYQRRVELQGEWQGEGVAAVFVVAAAHAIEDPRYLPAPPERWRVLSLDAAGVTIGLDDGTDVRAAAPLPLLTRPGLALAQSALQALGEPELPPADIARQPAAAPTLPATFRVGLRVGGYTVQAIAPRGPALELTLGSRGHRFVVQLQANSPGVPYVLRKADWAIQIADASDLPPAARAALLILVRALPTARAAPTQGP